MLADGLLHNDNKISIRCCCFFLNETLLNDGEDDQTSYNILSKKQLKKQLSVDRKRNKNFVVRQIDRNTISFDAIDFLPDPQYYAEKLFENLKKNHNKFVYRVYKLRVVSRMISRIHGYINGLLS